MSFSKVESIGGQGWPRSKVDRLGPVDIECRAKFVSAVHCIVAVEGSGDNAAAAGLDLQQKTVVDKRRCNNVRAEQVFAVVPARRRD